MTAAETTAEEVRDADLVYIVDSLATELPQMEGGRLLITGGAGFLGYYLVQSILFWNRNGARDPIAVTLVDNFRRGAPAWLEMLGDRPDLALVTHDVTLPVPRGVGPADYVIHAAGIAVLPSTARFRSKRWMPMWAACAGCLMRPLLGSRGDRR
jgi:UDP-glucuronate decarboxylase